MVVRKAQVSSANWRLTFPLNADRRTPISEAKMADALKAAAKDKNLGRAGAEALGAAYARAREVAKGDPTSEQIRKQISKVLTSFANERAKGRVNDGYVDKREAALVKGELAEKLYAYLSSSGKYDGVQPKEKFLKTGATEAQISKAVMLLSKVVDEGFKKFDANPDKFEEGPANALRLAAREARLSAAARSAVMTALNGATRRTDSGRGPTAADVKAVLTSAQGKLALADGAAIVDFERPTEAPKTSKDGRTTGLEVDRTPAVAGNTARALLTFASSL